MALKRFTSRSSMDGDTHRVTFSMQPELLEYINDRLHYSVNRSATFRQAVAVYLALPDDVHARLEADERPEHEIFRDALRAYYHTRDAGMSSEGVGPVDPPHHEGEPEGEPEGVTDDVDEAPDRDEQGRPIEQLSAVFS